MPNNQKNVQNLKKQRPFFKKKLTISKSLENLYRLYAASFNFVTILENLELTKLLGN